ncbi:large ribosomal subunit protein eL22-like [Bos javanicus]|uniref:large ribosomal subunit protein eL22-like n=1 Tax=Bos javanicus TaxID=9906 RepID=UPI002AA6EE68|nr:large ribosomal subunit protein eL22-like [Bos javanicus]
MGGKKGQRLEVQGKQRPPLSCIGGRSSPGTCDLGVTLPAPSRAAAAAPKTPTSRSALARPAASRARLPPPPRAVTPSSRAALTLATPPPGTAAPGGGGEAAEAEEEDRSLRAPSRSPAPPLVADPLRVAAAPRSRHSARCGRARQTEAPRRSEAEG